MLWVADDVYYLQEVLWRWNVFIKIKKFRQMGAVVNRCCDYELYEKQITCRSSLSYCKSPVKSLPSTGTIRKQTSLQELLKIQMIEQPPDSVLAIKEEDDQGSFIDEVIVQKLASRKQFQVRSLQQFNLIRVIGQSSLGSVFQVSLKQEASGGVGTKYAMKRLARQRLANHKAFASFKLQKQILTSMSNPFISQLRYAFTDKNFIYLIMEQAAADASVLVQNPKIRFDFRQLGDEGIRFLAGCVVLALEYLHQQHILFRDLKLNKVLLFSDGYAKLTDFGLDRIILCDHQLQFSQSDSTLYEAPEILMNVAYSKYVDFWALGVMLYELATGLTPFVSEDISSKSKFKKVVKEQENAHNWRGIKIKEDLQSLVAGLLRYKPDERLGVRRWFEIKEHSFFKGFDWQSLSSKTLKSPLQGLGQMFNRPVQQLNQRSILGAKIELISHFQTASEDAFKDVEKKGRAQAI